MIQLCGMLLLDPLAPPILNELNIANFTKTLDLVAYDYDPVSQMLLTV